MAPICITDIQTVARRPFPFTLDGISPILLRQLAKYIGLTIEALFQQR